MSHRVSRAMELATTALLTADLQLAEQVISEDVQIDNIQHDLDAKALSLLARQQPVAGDLRTIVTSLRMSADIEAHGRPRPPHSKNCTHEIPKRRCST